MLPACLTKTYLCVGSVHAGVVCVGNQEAWAFLFEQKGEGGGRVDICACGWAYDSPCSLISGATFISG